jgi:magnesium chelatase family protein
MVARVQTVAFQGIEVLPVDVQVQITGGLPTFSIVGLADKAVAESKERVRSALHSMGLALPPRRITVNLAPADLAKEGSHFDLPIALAVLVAMEVVQPENVKPFVVLGELGLDSQIASVNGVLPAAIHAASLSMGLICAKAQGGEAAWAGEIDVLAPGSLLALVNHFAGRQMLSPPSAKIEEVKKNHADLKDVKGQENAKRALEIAAAGGHNLLMIGPPGAGKSMLAARLAGILPELSPSEALQVSMIHSIAGNLNDGKLLKQRPFRDPHHSASLPALAGGGLKAKPGEISLAHRGVLFLDELPEFSRGALEALRQPLETGQVSIARANAHVTYPARFQLIAALNPCKCGYMGDTSRECGRAPRCGKDYQNRISGPLIDRFDLVLEVPSVSVRDLNLPAPKEGSLEIGKRVQQTRDLQQQRFDRLAPGQDLTTNAEISGDLLDQIATPEPAGIELLQAAAEKLRLSARGYHRVLRVSRTIADMAGHDQILRQHVAEALQYRHRTS